MIAINNISKELKDTTTLFNAISFRHNELDITLALDKIAKIERKIAKIEEGNMSDDDKNIIAGLKAEINKLDADIDELKTANSDLNEDYTSIIEALCTERNDEIAVHNLISFYACHGMKRYYAVAFEVEENSLLELHKALEAYFDHTSSDSTHNIHSKEDYTKVKKSVEFILNHSFSLNEDTSVLTRKKVKANNALIKGIIDSYIQSVQSVLVGKAFKKYAGTTVKTLVKASKKGDTDYSKLLATVVDLCVIPQYTVAK